MLSGFREKDFLEQITILNDVAGKKDSALIDDLLDLFTDPVGDKSVDYMVVNALNEILTQNEAETVKHLGSESESVRTLCVRVSSEGAFATAAPVLAKMAETETDQDKLFEILTALSHIKSDDSLPIFRKHLEDDEPFIASMSIEMVGVFKDLESLDALKAMIDAGESEENYHECAVTTWKAIEAVASIGSEDGFSYLVDKLHHRNPTARRIITDVLTEAGAEVIKPLGDKLANSQDMDERILAANILGFIGDRKGANPLVAEIDRGTVEHPNLRYAVFEALGRVGTMKGIICLVDALTETDELTLMAVVTGLNRHVNPGMIKTFLENLKAGNEQADRLGKAVIASRSLAIFQALYADEDAGKLLSAALVKSRDPEVLDAFREKLGEIGTDQAQADLAALEGVETGETALKALAADDSKSMVALYRSILTDMGLEPFIGGNGQEAYEHVEAGETFDVVITDMNMPVMDGLQLVEKLRDTPGLEATPIIMVTTESEGSQRGLAEQAGVTAFLTKPFKPDQLKELITSLVNG